MRRLGGDIRKWERPGISGRIVLLYAAVAVLWIVFSDAVVVWLAGSPEVAARFQTAKGLLYVAVTTALLYVLIRRGLRQLSHETKARSESEERYRRLIEGANDGVVIITDTTFTECNRRACEMLGRGEEEILGQKPWDFSPEFQPDGQRSEEKGRNMLRALAAEDGGVRVFNWMHTKGDGSLIEIEVSLASVALEEEHVLVTSWRDMTERRQAEENLRAALEEVSRLRERVEAENTFLREEVKLAHLHGDIVGCSKGMVSVLAQAEEVAPTDSTVLLLGETGTGKELLARAIHNMSPRAKKPLVTVNCAAMPGTLVESELFGREKGAYTGALSRQIGRFEAADGGTIFLDEIGELPIETQAKLLRVLQEGQFERLGNARTISVDVRVLAATNRDLEQEVRAGNFRQDLLFRLNVVPITIPPLRERREDVEPLVWSVIRELSAGMGSRIESISQADMDRLRDYAWPGNVRELHNVVERAMIGARGPILKIRPPVRPTTAPSTEIATLDDMQRSHIRAALENTDWRIRGENGAARILGLKPSTLESRMVKLGIKRPQN